MNYKYLLYELRKVLFSDSSNTILKKPTKTVQVNLNNRLIDAPKALSVQSEHRAETIYFIVDRYYDYMDLAQTSCAIQYVVTDDNGEEHGYIYSVPYCDIYTLAAENKMIIPWSVSSTATKNGGTISYFIRFYIINDNSVNKNDPENEPNFIYSLCTQAASSLILPSLPNEYFGSEDDEFELPTRYEELMENIQQVTNNVQVCWLEADELIQQDKNE